jgi:hypothetical protein
MPPDPPDLKAQQDALAPKQQRPPRHVQTGYLPVVGTFAPGEQMEALMRVLRNLPTARPSEASLRQQLTGPTLVAIKSLYDIFAAIVKMNSDGLSVGQVFLLCIALLFLAWSVSAADTFRRIHQEAMTKPPDPNYEWALTYVQGQIDAFERRASENTEPPQLPEAASAPKGSESGT